MNVFHVHNGKNPDGSDGPNASHIKFIPTNLNASAGVTGFEPLALGGLIESNAAWHNGIGQQPVQA